MSFHLTLVVTGRTPGTLRIFIEQVIHILLHIAL